MEPNTTYRPPFGLGERFVDGKEREFEIIETHWGIPGQSEPPSGIGYTLELTNGHRINMYGAPDKSVLQKVGFKQIGNPTAVTNTHPVEVMQQLIDERKIVMR
ncbi:MAG TPA: hypothetical protein VNQ80_12380 [Parapedobacter sp.]|uniref:hypothetical protein n=1 Tax=Parapedobacter sp. TaxID=1958893 RepID=UPI002B742DC6|nr:hypothetical protein [Parapedobacter sp.]HWK58134.1 hypothetical protein [Parapedobacter sp.]